MLRLDLGPAGIAVRTAASVLTVSGSRNVGTFRRYGLFKHDHAGPPFVLRGPAVAEPPGRSKRAVLAAGGTPGLSMAVRKGTSLAV